MSGAAKSIAGLVAQWEAIAGQARGGPSKSVAAAGVGQSDPRQCLIEMLEVAAQLEFATIPPYLCALWSVENELDSAAESIREVVQEEMLHLALVCNLLAAIGAEVKLRDWAPRYPTSLPGQVHEGLEVWLQKLDKDTSLKDFIRIESPEQRPDNVDVELGDPYWPEGKTIGALYEMILAAFRHLKPPLQTDRQVTGPLSWRSVATLADVEWAIRIIQHQGEGAVIGPLDSSQSDLAHYYRFLELWKGKRLRFDKEEGRFYWRGKLAFPKCRPMERVPKGGYANPGSRAARHLQQFDKAYHRMLVDLENAWRRPAPDVTTGQGALVRAYVSMFDLGKHARTLMTIPTGAADGLTYGPQFTPPPRNEPPPQALGSAEPAAAPPKESGGKRPRSKTGVGSSRASRKK